MFKWRPPSSSSRRVGLVAGGLVLASTSWIVFQFAGDGFSAEGADAYLEESAQLAICVEVDPSLSTGLAAVHSAVEQAVRGGLRASHDEVHRRWLEEGSIEHMFAYTEPRVVAGCPDGYQGPPGEEPSV